MKLTSLLGNSQKLDGGAMFGNVPKAMWSQWVDVDEQNRIPLACRCLLVQGDFGNVLLETGVGAFFDPKLKSRFGVVEDEHVLLKSLADVGLSDKDIDMVILSHLHFDHAGGLCKTYQEGAPLGLHFENADVVLSEKAWERARHPHARDKASFIPDMIPLLKEKKLHIVREEGTQPFLPPGMSIRFSEGHTPGMMLTEIKTEGGPVVFGADLIPATPWVHLPVTMGYDRYPEKLIEEKKELLEYLVEHKGRLFYTHDPDVALSTIEKNEKGRFVCGVS